MRKKQAKTKKTKTVSSDSTLEDFVKSSISSEEKPKKASVDKAEKKAKKSKPKVVDSVEPSDGDGKKAKKTKVKKSETVEGEKSTYFKIGPKVFNPKTAIVHDVYTNVDSDHTVTQTTPIGTRILVAKYPDFYKIYLYETHAIGDPHFPYGGVTAYNVTYEMLQYFPYQGIAIHPSGGSYRFRSKSTGDDIE